MKLPTGQQRVFDFIRAFIAEKGYAPTIRECMVALGIKSPQGVHCHLRAMKHKGIIDWEPLKSRTIRILEQPDAE